MGQRLAGLIQLLTGQQGGITYTPAMVTSGAAAGAPAGSLSSTLSGSVSYSVLFGALVGKTIVMLL